MSTTTNKETLGFQSEVKQILHLMIHSLYSNKEIFLRELISNASDAAEKLRFEALNNHDLYEGKEELDIRIEYDKDNRTLKITDNGIGMSRQEVIDNVGTIARSGTKSFLQQLTGDAAKDSQLIGQFGVGFYSTFIIADEVTLETRRAGLDASEGVRWVSKGEGDYTLETIHKPVRGTSVTLMLKEGEDEFLDGFTLRHIIKKYSDHINLPIMLPKETLAEEEDASPGELETVNQATALWTLPKNEVSEEEYQNFYKMMAHDFESPLAWTHNRVEGKLDYTYLLYIPSRAPFDLYEVERQQGVKLYVNRVFILEDKENLMPRYLRFIRGVFDSSDLPLNVSREILQQNKAVDSMRAGAVKKILTVLERMAENDVETYQKFWDQFGRVMKEGPSEDFSNKDQIANLLRFASTYNGEPAQTVSLRDYISRMQEGQETIYYITADSFIAGKNSPHLEVFRKKGIEVLILSDSVDEWMTSHLTEFEGHPISSVARGELGLEDFESDSEKEQKQKAEAELKDVLTRIKEQLNEKVEEVRFTSRLTESPACLVVGEQDMSMNLERMLKAAGHDVPHVKPILEVNPTHPIVKQLAEEQSEERFHDWSMVLFEQALLSEGGQLDDPATFVHRLNSLLFEMVG